MNHLLEMYVQHLCILSFSSSYKSLLTSISGFASQYDFEGRYDLVKFIKTVHKVGLYVHLRIGPYVCAEWNFGHVLNFKPLPQSTPFSGNLQHSIFFFLKGNNISLS